MSWKVTVEPVAEPLTLNEAKDNLRVQHTAEDGLIERCITAARDYCEQELDLAIIEQEITLRLDRFPSEREIVLPRANLLAVSSVAYIDAEGTEQEFTDYTADAYRTPARIVNNTGAWPSTSKYAGSVTIVYTAGFKTYSPDDSTLTPAAVKQAMHLLISHWYENRKAVVVGSINSQLSLAVESCLMKYRRLGL